MVTTPHEYESSTIHVFSHSNIIADWNEHKCSIMDCSISNTATETLAPGQLYSSSGRRTCIARIKKNQKFAIISGKGRQSTTRVYYYNSKPSIENSVDLLYPNPSNPSAPLYNTVYDGDLITAREDGWIAFAALYSVELGEKMTAVVLTDMALTNYDASNFFSPNEQTGTVTFDTPIEGHDVGDKPYAYYDWVTGMLTDGERFYPKQDAPFIPFILNGDYYIYFDEGIATVSYLTWNQGDRLYRFMLNQEDRIPVLTDNDERPIAGIVLEPETGFDEKETPIEIQNLERKE